MTNKYMSSLSDYVLLHMSSNLTDILQSGYLYSIKKLNEMDDKYEPLNSGNLTPFIYMTFINKENIEFMESVNYYLMTGQYFYFVFD
jgi:hypothetical protein